MIEVDGSFGEGGGQILRTSLALAAVLGEDVRISKIRARRSEPGLRAQHMTAVSALSRLCNASLEGLKIGSTQLVFKPRHFAGGHFRLDVGTAGSVALVLQALMPVVPFGKGISLELRGGTDVKWSPPIDYLQLVTLPILRRMGLVASLETVRRGHYPKGGGIVKFESKPLSPLSAIEVCDGERVVEVSGVSHVSNLPRHVAERQAESASKILLEHHQPRALLTIDASVNDPLRSPGSGIVLVARASGMRILGGDSLGERGKPAESVGEEAAKTLLEEIHSDCFLDRHMGDMIVPYMALAEGVSDVSVSRITQHIITNVRMAESVTGVQFDSLGELGKPGRLRVRGLGLTTSGAASPREPIPIWDL